MISASKDGYPSIHCWLRHCLEGLALCGDLHCRKVVTSLKFIKFVVPPRVRWLCQGSFTTLLEFLYSFVTYFWCAAVDVEHVGLLPRWCQISSCKLAIWFSAKWRSSKISETRTSIWGHYLPEQITTKENWCRKASRPFFSGMVAENLRPQVYAHGVSAHSDHPEDPGADHLRRPIIEVAICRVYGVPQCGWLGCFCVCSPVWILDLADDVQPPCHFSFLSFSKQVEQNRKIRVFWFRWFRISKNI